MLFTAKRTDIRAASDVVPAITNTICIGGRHTLALHRITLFFLAYFACFRLPLSFAAVGHTTHICMWFDVEWQMINKSCCVPQAAQCLSVKSLGSEALFGMHCGAPENVNTHCLLPRQAFHKRAPAASLNRAVVLRCSMSCRVCDAVT